MDNGRFDGGVALADEDTLGCGKGLLGGAPSAAPGGFGGPVDGIFGLSRWFFRGLVGVAVVTPKACIFGDVGPW